MAFKVTYIDISLGLLKVIPNTLFKLSCVIALFVLLWHSSAHILKLFLDVFFLLVL